MAGSGAIDLKVPLKSLERQAGEFVRQIPFAISYATNKLAYDARKHVISNLDDDFIIRSRHVEKGIRVTTGTKKNPAATVGSIDEFMAGQAVRATQEGTQYIPVVGKGRPRITASHKTPQSRWPGGKMWKKKDTEGKKTVGNVFTGVPRHHRKAGLGSGRIRGVWQRVLRRGVPGIKLLYRLHTAVKSPGKWPIDEYVAQTVKLKLGERMDEAIEFAIKTAKKKK